jgi:hypothetical protein
MYSSICPNCGEKSEHNIKDCPGCGFEKTEIVNKVGIFQSINDSLVDKLNFLDYPQLYVTIIFRLVILLITIFVIPDFIGNSEFFWMVIGIFSVYGLIKEVAKNYAQLRILYKTSKLLLFSFFGAGFGNLISHAGKFVYFKFSYYFNIAFMYDEISKANAMILFGALAGIGMMLLINYFGDEFNVDGNISEDDKN